MTQPSLASGSRLGPYEIVSAAGAGGMGEVYRATDTRLGRAVAIKILPPHLAADPDLTERFEREARAIAGLSHPHVCTLHDVGHDNGIAYLVMEFLEGQTLATALERGALSLDAALKTAIQIADALDAAHRAGIVHRDLKPGNVMLTPAGVKVLDFGLARIGVEPSAAATSSHSFLPTAKQAPLTARGTILGTFQYMAPEQLEGQEADTRTDVFAFGAVLYEMLTGRRAFEGTSQASLIGAILKDEPPPITTSQPVAPPALDHVVRRCLAKRADDRWQSIRDARLELEWLLTDDARKQVSIAAPPPRRRWPEVTAWGFAAAGLVAAIALLLAPRGSNLIGPLVRLDLAPPSELHFRPQGALMAVPSPDGRWIALSSAANDAAPIQLQNLQDSTREVLEGTEAGVAPFWSPDSRQIGYFQDGRMLTRDISGGSPQVVCQCSNTTGSWLDRDTILYSSPPSEAGGINRLRLSTRTSDKVTELDASREERGHRLPHALPDGRHFVFIAQHTPDPRWRTYIGSVDSRDRIELPIESNVAYVEPGFLLFGKDDSLMAQSFDLKRLQLRGEPFRVAPVLRNQEVRQNARGRGNPNNRNQNPQNNQVPGPYRYFASRNGVLVFWPGEDSRLLSQLQWVDRNGNVLSTVSGVPAEYSNPSLSPDGTRLAVGIRPAGAGATRDIWLLDLQQGGRQQVTRDPGDDLNPLWDPDNRTIYFSSNRTGPRRIYRGDSRAIGKEQIIPIDDPDTRADMNLEALSSQGLLYNRNSGEDTPGPGSLRLELLPLTGGPAKVVVEPPSARGQVHKGQVSPDGHWLAYTLQESQRMDVYVTTFPTAGRPWRISTQGGSQPQWSAATGELIYIEGNDRFMAVRVTTTHTEFKADTPRPLFERPLTSTPNFRNKYLIDKDGQRFLINAAIEKAREARYTVFADWRALLPKP